MDGRIKFYRETGWGKIRQPVLFLFRGKHGNMYLLSLHRVSRASMKKCKGNYPDSGSKSTVPDIRASAENWQIISFSEHLLRMEYSADRTICPVFIWIGSDGQYCAGARINITVPSHHGYAEAQVFKNDLVFGCPCSCNNWRTFFLWKWNKETEIFKVCIKNSM